MPGSVAFFMLVFAAIAGLICALIAYWLSKYTRLEAKTGRAVMAGIVGLIVAFGLIWDFERYQTYEISDQEAEMALEPLLAHGGIIKQRYAFTEGLAYGDYYLVEISNENFSSFIAERPHGPSSKSSFLENAFGWMNGPEWFKDFECKTGKAYKTDFTEIEHEIDKFDLLYCAETNELIAAKLRV